MNLKENECNQYRADAGASKLDFWLVSLISKPPLNAVGCFGDCGTEYKGMFWGLCHSMG